MDKPVNIPIKVEPVPAVDPNDNGAATLAWLNCNSDDERKAVVKRFPQLVRLHSGAANFAT